MAPGVATVEHPTKPCAVRVTSRGPMEIIWVNYNELTTSSLEIIVSKGNHPQMALIQVSELLQFAQKSWENHGKTRGKPGENGDLYGKIHHFEWINQRNGHFQ